VNWRQGHAFSDFPIDPIRTQSALNAHSSRHTISVTICANQTESCRNIIVRAIFLLFPKDDIFLIFYVVWTVHFGIKLYNDQRTAQGFNLFIYLLLPYMFRAFF
jgi:hypothetical protein